MKGSQTLWVEAVPTEVHRILKAAHVCPGLPTIFRSHVKGLQFSGRAQRDMLRDVYVCISPHIFIKKMYVYIYTHMYTVYMYV